MADLISGQDWLGPVHHLAGRPFGAGPLERLTVVGALAKQARDTPDARFLSELGDEPRFVTYSEAHRTVSQQAAVLAAHRLNRGDRVGLLGHNSIDFALAVLSVLEAGCVAVLLSHLDPPARTSAQVEFAQVQLVLCDSGLLGVAEACAVPRRKSFRSNSSSHRAETRTSLRSQRQDRLMRRLSSSRPGRPAPRKRWCNLTSRPLRMPGP